MEYSLKLLKPIKDILGTIDSNVPQDVGTIKGPDDGVFTETPETYIVFAVIIVHS